ncbi:anoctamin-8 [Geospiza fortis]|uniref:Anoctamin n=1 Tax=Geospiza fortis TaxID=48883 RepID=A0A8N5I4W9_GEOFO|nr:anoctamin-8 [Geospiza fortis]
MDPSPDKLFGKRLLQAGRYIMSHKAWMKTVPTENCDVLMTFPDSTDDHIPELAARGVIQQLFPLHEQRILKRLMKSWVQAVCEAQPLDDICDYFGVKIAMYFAWLGFYTSAMVYPAVFGSILYSFTDSDQTSQDISCVVFAIFNVIWATLFLEEWKRRGAEFAYKWGTLDTPAESLEEPRPQFRGTKRISPVTSAEEFYYPPWKRLLFQSLVSLPVCLACLTLVFLLMLGCFQLQELVLSIQELPRVLRFLPKIILAVIVTACDELYKKVALWLNDMENYRLQSAYEKHLIIKMVLFQFVNSYLSLFYIGFYLKDMERLKELLLILSLSQSLARQLREALLPSILLHLHLSLIFLRRLLRFCWTLGVSKVGAPGGAAEPAVLARRRRREEEEGEEEGRKRNRASWIDPPEEDYSTQLTQAEVESCMKKYEDTFQDYQEMFIQFGYVVLFSSAFPLAAACALLNNVLEIRSDAFKLCTGLQRPFGQRVASIGHWQKVMEAMGVLAIVVNCYLIAQCGQLQRLFPGLSPQAHFALLLKYVIQVAIPDIPAWVAEEMAKLEYQRREAFKVGPARVASPR